MVWLIVELLICLFFVIGIIFQIRLILGIRRNTKTIKAINKNLEEATEKLNQAIDRIELATDLEREFWEGPFLETDSEDLDEVSETSIESRFSNN